MLEILISLVLYNIILGWKPFDLAQSPVLITPTVEDGISKPETPQNNSTPKGETSHIEENNQQGQVLVSNVTPPSPNPLPEIEIPLSPSPLPEIIAIPSPLSIPSPEPGFCQSLIKKGLEQPQVCL